MKEVFRLFQTTADKICPEKISIEITRAVRKEFGHFQCNSALKLTKMLKKSPLEIAKDFVELTLPFAQDIVEKMEVKPPGFINIWLRQDFIQKKCGEILQSERLGVPLSEMIKVICEFSSPNIAKLMHVGHLRSTIIGDSIARILEFLGHDVLRLNHVGDWGTQFGMLIQYILEKRRDDVDHLENAGAENLLHWYREAKKHFDADPEFQNNARKQVVDLQAHHPRCIEIWKKICAISRKEFATIYDLLDVEIQERGESFYNPLLEEVVEDFSKKGLVKISDGAKCVFMEQFQGKDGNTLPLIIQKSDGGYNYATTDLAGFKYRIQSDKAKWIIILTDLGQSLHFKMVYEAARQVGYIPPSFRFDHVGFGVVLSEGGGKFKTRSGDTIHLMDLLQGAITKARELLDERDVHDKEKIAQILGISAVKYADLSSTRTKDYTFSFERMLRFEGNTVVFILYAYVRIQSIFRKKGDFSPSIDHLFHASEIDLALLLLQFGDVIHEVTKEWMLHKLCEYLYEVSEAFHAFFRDCPVLHSPTEISRLSLCLLTAKTLEKGLELLGIPTVKEL